MAHVYPRNRRRIVAVSGIFDDLHDDLVSEVKWHETYKTGNLAWDVVSAPGGVGGNALWVKGTIGDAIGLAGRGHLSPYPNVSNQYLVPPSQPYRTKARAEFRMRIVDDQSSANAKLSHCASFCLDGAVKWNDDHMIDRTCVNFSVANQRMGIVSGTNGVVANIQTDIEWLGSLNTWYDVRIEWHYDHWDNRQWQYADWEIGYEDKTGDEAYQQVHIKVYINNVEVLATDIFKGHWRDTDYDFPTSMDFGRPGIGVNCENDDTGNVSNGTFAEVYYKDILITQDVILIDWKINNSAIYKGADRSCKARVFATFPESIAQGQDLQIHARNSTSDDWTGQFRGIIRSAVTDGRLVDIETEGYDSVLANELSEILSFASKTAQEIIYDAVNVPDVKVIFDVSTFFDTAATTYNRDYVHVPKMDIIAEMVTLSNFSLSLDMANAFHFEKFTNSRLYTDIHLVHGQDFAEYEESDLFIRRPNIIRVIGSGVIAQKEIAAERRISGSTIVREISRLDLTTQATVDDALDYYASAYILPFKVLEVTIPAKYAITPSRYIRISIAELGYNMQFAYVLNTTVASSGIMTISILSSQFDVEAFMADLNYRQTTSEAQDFPQDLTPSVDNINIEGMATFDISARFYIRDYIYHGETLGFQYTIVREGHMIVTNGFIDRLIDLVQTDDIPGQPLSPDRIIWGTGTTPARETDTSIESSQGNYFDVGSQDGDVRYGNGVGGFVSLQSIQWRKPAYTPTTFSNVSELVLAITGEDIACRATFEPYTAESSNSIEIEINISIWPRGGACYPTHHFCRYIGRWMERWVTNPFPAPKRISFFGTDTFPYPSVYLKEETEGGGTIVVCPADDADVTSWLVTTIKDKFMIKYEQVYTFDYLDRYDTADGDQVIGWIGTTDLDNSKTSSINLFFRTQQTLAELDGYETKIVIWLRFARRDPDTKKWMCLPRVHDRAVEGLHGCVEDLM